MNIISIPLTFIDLDPERSRNFVDKAALASLSASIAETGLLQPILVQQQGERYRLVAGERRLAAFRFLERSEIPAVILAGGSEAVLAHVVENIQREDLDPLERALTVQAFISEEQLSKREAARRLGVGRTTLTEWLDILAVDQRFQHAVVNHFYGGGAPLTLSHINLAKRFAAYKQDTSWVQHILDAVMYLKLSREELKRVLTMMARKEELSLEKAVRQVRAKLPSDQGDQPETLLEPERLAEILAECGDYLVRCRSEWLEEAEAEARAELVEKAKALQLGLKQFMEHLAGLAQE